MTVTVTSPRRTPKKTVKFSDSVEAVDQINSPEELEPAAQQDAITTPFSIRTVPVHFILIAYSILQQDLSHSNVFSNLLTHLYFLIVAQVGYSILFVSNIVEVKKNKKRRRVSFSIGKDYSHLFIGLLISLLLIFPIYILVVLFGAPFTTYLKENLVLAAHLSFIAHPIVVSFLKVGEKAAFYKFLIAIGVSAWLGAIAIPLDWDRPWQNWPLPIVISSYIGSFIGYSFGGLLS